MATISRIDQYVIDKVRKMREEQGLSQKELSLRMEFSEGFVGHAENPKRRDKYNLTHLNLLAKIFKCSIHDFLPEKPL
ncbi:helix-turn-helix domain-containing protein [Chitinophagaceae bacterium LWZ2-11]